MPMVAPNALTFKTSFPFLIPPSNSKLIGLVERLFLISMRADKKSVSKKHFEEAIKRVRPTITDEMMDYYNRMEARLTSGLESVRRSSEVHSGIESA